MTKQALSSSTSSSQPAKFDGKTKHLDKYVALPLKEISASGRRGRFIAPTPERIAKIAQSLARDGQYHPIVVSDLGLVKPHTQYRIISGATRYAAARELGWEWIQAKIVLGLSEDEEQIAELVENEFRADLSDEERKRIRARLKELRADQEKLLADALSELEDQPKEKGGRGKKGGLADAARKAGVPRTTARRRNKPGHGQVSDDKSPTDAPTTESPAPEASLCRARRDRRSIWRRRRRLQPN